MGKVEFLSIFQGFLDCWLRVFAHNQGFGNLATIYASCSACAHTIAYIALGNYGVD